jgi:hypothetical protein
MDGTVANGSRRSDLSPVAGKLCTTIAQHLHSYKSTGVSWQQWPGVSHLTKENGA